MAVLGALHTGRAATRRWPRFAVHTLHHNLAVLAVAFVAIHVATAIIDPYAGIRLGGRRGALRVDLPTLLDRVGRGRG